MHVITARRLALALLGASFATGAQADDFDAKRRLAQAHLATEAGRHYDSWLGEYFKARPEVEKELTDCMRTHAERPALEGYIAFERDGSYRYVLRPKGPFADCVASAFAGFAPPPPPTLPYLNPFELKVPAPAPRE